MLIFQILLYLPLDLGYSLVALRAIALPAKCGLEEFYLRKERGF